MNRKEDIEWTHIWNVNCNDVDKKRILLVGDSICSGYYDTVYERLKDDFYVDKLATSRSIASKMYEDQLCSLLEDLPYDYISLNNGLHAFGLTTEEYKAAYEKILRLLEQRVFLVKSTPILRKDTLDGYREDRNPIVLERNRVVDELASQYGLEVCDLYTCVDGKPELFSADGIHYTKEGFALLGNYLADFIKRTVEKNEGEI